MTSDSGPGADWLGTEQVIPPNDGVTLKLPPATYDLNGLDCDLEDVFLDQQEILGATELTY